MKTIQMTIDEELLAAVDTAVRDLGTSRSAFLREALQRALRARQIAALERQQIAGYERHPVAPDEFDVWQDEQVWEGVA
ncbi:ribbon-helix-helix domain-containing protein [Candidatus Leptofilum sp.]|uniref:ribbon-helix-helix domain-containing protein n=1 Tax=Candidatus Leptofilum sp. TaxID=3241576 RepID=UPI003B5B594E